MHAYTKFGLLLIALSIPGFIFVADELRHSGELMGVCSVLLSGLTFLWSRSKKARSMRMAWHWIAFGFLIGIPMGGFILDDMIVGIGIGFSAGLLLAYLKRNTEKLLV